MNRTVSTFWWALIVAATVFLGYAVAGCGPWKMGPFVPPNAQSCLADPDCPYGQHCAFPSLAYKHPVCMRGKASFDQYPPGDHHP